MAIGLNVNLLSRLLVAALLPLALLVMLTRPGFAQDATVPVEGLPSSLERDLARLLEPELPPDSLFAARRQADRAAETVSRLLESEGYFAATVEPYAEGTETFERGVRSTIGPLFIIGGSKLSFTDGPPDEATIAELEALLDLIPVGVPARAQPILDVADAMLAKLQNAGYPEAENELVDAVADAELNTLDLDFRFKTGRRTTFGDLQLSGLERTRQDFIRGLRPFREGDVVSQSELDEFRTRLSSTGIFNRTSVELAPSVPGARSRDVLVELSEGPRRSISLGGTASTSEGLGVEAQWQVRNVTGRADSITVDGQFATLERRLETSYNRPHLGRYDRNLELSAQIEDFETDAFDQTGGSLSASLDEQITRRVRGTIGLEAGYASILDQRARTLGPTRREVYLLAASAAAEYTGVRDILDPTNGIRARLFVEPGVTFGDDQIGFTRVIGETSLYRDLGSDKFVGAVRGRIGTIVGPAGVPPDRLFFAGGGGSVRGYEYQGLSPRDGAGNYIGGRSLVEGSAELRWRASDRLGYVAFVDAGAVGTDVEPDFDSIRSGVGFGVRYYAGFGPLRADIAMPLDKRDGDADFQIYISIGQAF